MREGLWRTKKGGPNISKTDPKNPKNPKMSKNGIWEVGEAVRNGAQRCATVRNGAQAFFPW